MCRVPCTPSRDSSLLSHSHSYKGSTLLLSVKSGMITWELLAVLLDKGKARQVGPRGELLTGPSLAADLSCGEGVCAAWPASHAGHGSCSTPKPVPAQAGCRMCCWLHRILLLCHSGSLCTSYPYSLEGSLETDSGSVIIASKVPCAKHVL